MPTKKTPSVPTKITAGTATSAPGVAFGATVIGQTPIMIEHSISFTAGEDVQCLVRMKDGTCVYIPESQLAATTGVVKI